MRAIITVIGRDNFGIIAKVSGRCSDYNVNIVDITQKVFIDTFAMIMMVDISRLNIPFTDFVDRLRELGDELSLSIHTMHEDIFNSMHRV